MSLSYRKHQHNVNKASSTIKSTYCVYNRWKTWINQNNHFDKNITVLRDRLADACSLARQFAEVTRRRFGARPLGGLRLAPPSQKARQRVPAFSRHGSRARAETPERRSVRWLRRKHPPRAPTSVSVRRVGYLGVRRDAPLHNTHTTQSDPSTLPIQK